MPSRPAPDFASAQESLVPARLRVRGGEVVGIVDHLGNDIGLPVTARKSSDQELVIDDGNPARAVVVAEMDGGGNPTGNFTQTAAL